RPPPPRRRGPRAARPNGTLPHGNLSLDVGVKGRRLGLGQVRRPDVSVSGARLRARIPLHAADGTPVRLRFTSAGRTLYTPGALTAGPQRPGTLLEATLPSGLPRGIWRVALCLDPEAAEPRVGGLPFALRAGRGGVLVVQVPRPGTAEKLLRRARRVLGAARTRVAPLIKRRR
ncbi:glycosyltransferase family 2 protein, partial [Streptomyces prasinus]